MNELRQDFSSYLHDMAPFYFDLLTQYLECLSKQTEYTLEDIDVFRKVVSLFSIIEDTQIEEESKEIDEDFLKPKQPKKQENNLYMFNGFVPLKSFK